ADDERDARRARRADLREGHAVERATVVTDVELVEQVGDVELERRFLARRELADVVTQVEVDQRVGRHRGVVQIVDEALAGVLDLRTEFHLTEVDLTTRTYHVLARPALADPSGGSIIVLTDRCDAATELRRIVI